MTDPIPGEAPASPPAREGHEEQDAQQEPDVRLRPLLRTRQYREFTDRVPGDTLLAAILDVARWTGSSTNSQPWRFILIRDQDVIRRIANAGMPLTRSLRTATAAIAIVLPLDPARATSFAYDEGRASERVLIAASMLGLGAGIAWIRPEVRPAVHELLGLPGDRMLRTVMALGYPTEAARAPKAAPGAARLPREQTVFEGRWPAAERKA